ncbi:diphosphomevalonate decarboxylase [Liquorilactobacillus oeni]|uniref:diphosphomevalonate decarboxylase n=1 Tax=Liquorilactobacillus oeni DSM 19972 TaxID=1423777 RepID=A0A0R1M7B4_9LACO|nr:diphosphomevalonate decarboxylase [Liquorilactobacillus oeni]KRL04221.1 diphosphomevalonate decarboxylase [Liquorilactobacillus oeni DSM 19972]
MRTEKYTARAHTNIALIKYWGKLDQDLIIPMNSSLSLTLDKFYTDTSVFFDSDLDQDSFILDGVRQQNTKVTHVLDLLRRFSGEKRFAVVESFNHVPSAAGLASSASAFAALSLAASKAAGLNLDRRALSRLARRGSGSATRSIYGGFVEWQQGHDDASSYAVPLEENLGWNICMIAVVINAKQKKISSRVGMQRVVSTSPYYEGWKKTAKEDLIAIKRAIKQRNLERVGMIAEENALKMHALNLSARPHFSYFEPGSLLAMKIVENLRSEGISCYYTLDAGPNVKIICAKKDTEVILSALESSFSRKDLIVAGPGPGAELIDNP